MVGAASSASFVLRAPAAAADALTVRPSHPAELTVTPSSLVLAKGAIAEATVTSPSHAHRCSSAARCTHTLQATLLPQHSGKRMFIVNVLSGTHLCMARDPRPLGFLLLVSLL